MAMEVATTDLYTCDGCGSIKHAMPGETVPGYSGTVVRTLPNGDQTDAPWWAHTFRCIGNAAKNALTRATLRWAAEAETNPPVPDLPS